MEAEIEPVPSGSCNLGADGCLFAPRMVSCNEELSDSWAKLTLCTTSGAILCHFLPPFGRSLVVVCSALPSGKNGKGEIRSEVSFELWCHLNSTLDY
jgi:hypothetical protein